MKKRISEEIDKILKEYGYQRCKDGIYKDVHSPIKCIDNEGYIVMAILVVLRKNNFPSRIHVCNPYTLDNIKHYISLNNIKYKLKDGQKYKGTFEKLTFICEKHGEFLKSWDDFSHKSYCGKCSGGIKEVWDGNRLSIIRPDLIKYFINPEDANNYSFSSNKKLLLRCPDCGKEKKTAINDLSSCGFRCPNCSDGISIPEKYARSILNQLKVDYIPEMKFEWSGNKRYDFYVGNKYIIEIHGEQHYKKNCFGKDNTVKLEDVQKNDLIKKELAIKNGILFENYIEIPCINSYSADLKKQFIKYLSKHFDLSEINWSEANKFCMNSLMEEACKLWSDGIRNITEIAKILNVHDDTIRNYLKRGKRSNLCDYDAKEQSKLGSIKSGKKKGKPVLQYDSEGNFIKEYPSATEASIQIGINNKNISLVASGKSYRKKAGGFMWKYKE